ncbi:MAG: nitrous oxide reductase family maturation protein NosD [Bacteroidetes bacterium]|nr:nitrous oxide reductase family maturation protein NosD [Bacteroidota bacterium]
MSITKNTNFLLAFILLLLGSNYVVAKTIYTGKEFTSIKAALNACVNGDTLIITKGVYREGNIVIDKSIVLLGENKPVLDGELKYEIISVKSNFVVIKGLVLKNCGRMVMNDPAAIKVYDVKHVLIENNTLLNNYFGIYLQYSQGSIVKNNVIKASQKEEHQSGNGIHCWKSDSLQITGNRISGHRDGIYFEFVTHSVVWRNIAENNLRYGLHFMFSNNDAYFTNYFKNNGAGVAVMFTKHVIMVNNTFEENWGDAAYGLLLKEISDGYLAGNIFVRNTTGVFFDGSNRITVEKNVFQSNGWGMRMQANCMDNVLTHNNFFGNTFDISTNGSLTLNRFNENYWDKYEGYDLDKNRIGDIPYRPLSLYSVIVEKNPPAMLLYRSFIIGLLDKSEKVLPSLTPENFVDNNPLMKPFTR